MKFSSLPVSFYADFSAGRRTLADWFRFAAAIGLDGADISVAHLADLTPTYLDGLRQQAVDAGVQIAMIVTYADFTHPDAAERRGGLGDSAVQLDWPNVDGFVSQFHARCVARFAEEGEPRVPRSRNTSAIVAAAGVMPPRMFGNPVFQLDTPRMPTEW